VVGFYREDNSGKQHGFLYENGKYTTIDPPGAFNTYVTGINNKSQIVGNYTEASGGFPHGFIFSHGTYTILNFPGAVVTNPYSINDLGEVVGFYEDGVAGPGPGGAGGQITSQYAFVYSAGTYTVIAPPGSLSPQAFGINNKGQIVGSYDDSVGNQHAFLATPVRKRTGRHVEISRCPDPKECIKTRADLGVPRCTRGRSTPISF
jgi:probable HAF family extracellular repeat protein